MKKIAILGSTGSIGTQTLEVVRENKDLRVTALAAGNNLKLLEQQVREFHPSLVAVWKEENAAKLRLSLKDLEVKVASGMDGLIEVAASGESEILVTAIVGMIGIRPTIEAIKAGKDIALANKETLVTAGHIIMPMAEKYNVSILPVDSEHSAIFQSLQGGQRVALHKILLTASGGPFRGKTWEDLQNIQVEDALKHPNWEMGRKITIDSSTMVNKGLEVIEAKWLFGVTVDQVEVVVQPQSIIHSMVEYEDGAIIAELGTPDMKLPIQYALYYPERRYLPGDRLDFKALSQITFEQPDMETFYGLRLAYEAGRRGGSLPTVLNAANELAVSKFLNRKIRYLEIPEIIETCMNHHQVTDNPTVEEILQTEAETYEFIESRW
ncbi:1-deoxy-D-xylulose-5-phosphate reductoisomerase [Hespellia stercorisuis]|uniref:1-deoxy-D-xylulose 5-phosphate reductoisomerase n=1 Tax=Hespellia stercorisuis DSM 15480 TaxID=1121950 RepID=A0A1M6HUF7_9FIRM|nr:1-deoxy-D-xylulose-5-phosphate reductoisomerase [Hespellia stercorisuis]SHJ25825.1 1-deoxy-D-xylulose 5-phosphate reductoisomerase [Hespellia stercorisuis DSM 15480]